MFVITSISLKYEEDDARVITSVSLKYEGDDARGGKKRRFLNLNFLKRQDLFEIELSDVRPVSNKHKHKLLKENHDSHRSF